MDERGSLDLVQAIVKQAVKDWQFATKKLKNSKTKKISKNAIYESKRTINECERFFKSDWFYELTGVDGSSILRRLKVDTK